MLEKFFRLVKESWYFEWRESIINNPVKLIITDIIFILTIITTIFAIKDSYINWHQRRYETDTAALEYYRIGEKYYADKSYEESLVNFEKAYNINKNLFDVKYYYTMSLLRINEKDNSQLVRKILYENSEFLNDNEKAIFALLEVNSKNYSSCVDILDSISDPIELKNEIFNQYIITSTVANFALNFETGQNKVFNNKMLIDRKINSLGLLPDNNIKKFDDVTITFDTQGYFKDEFFKINQGAVEMFIFYLNECMQQEEYGRILPVMEIASSYFNVFSTKESVAKDYLKHFYDCMDMFSGYNETHLKSIDTIIKNIVSKLENGNSGIWAEDLIKCKQIYNSIIDDYNTIWIPYN